MYLYCYEKLPKVKMTGKTIVKNKWHHGGRTPSANILLVVHEGECSFSVGEKTYNMKAQDAVFVPKGVFYRPQTKTFCEYSFIHFDGELKDGSGMSEAEAAEYTSSLSLGGSVSLAPKWNSFLLCLNGFKELQTDLVENRRLKQSVLFINILILISECYNSHKAVKGYPRPLVSMLNYIRSNYQKELSLEDIALSAGISKQYAMALFRKYTGCTVNEYILTLRMQHAARLLSYGDMRISEISEYLGYSSPAYFSRVFKKYYGVSPLGYTLNV